MIIFLLTYIFIIVFYNKKLLIVWASVAVLLLSRNVTIKEAWRAIDWNIILLYFGMLLVSEVFLFSKMPDFVASLLASKAKRVSVAMLLICFFTGILSIALENVAVVLLVAPIGLSIAKRCEINAVPLFIGMAISANLQGAATLIGDPPSMLLAGYADLSFNDFIVFHGRPGIFFAIQISAVVAGSVLFFVFRKYGKKMPSLGRERYSSLFPSVLVLTLIASLIVSSSIDHDFRYMTGLLCGVFGVLSFIWYIIRTRSNSLSQFLSKLDWQTGVFLIGIFISVEALTIVGLMTDMANVILRISGSNPFITYMSIVWIAVVLSAFIDNIPFLMAMLPVIKIITLRLGMDPYPYYIGLLIGASIGGNITPIGASANIVAMGIIRKNGYAVKFMDFVKIGLPFSVAAVFASSLFIWLIFK
jgi:Na+/H+ antiporter NhaD/arsenite permease-like protein